MFYVYIKKQTNNALNMIIKGAYTLSHQVTLKTAIISYDFSKGECYSQETWTPRSSCVMKFTHASCTITRKLYRMYCINNTKYHVSPPNHMPVYFIFHTNIIIQNQHMLHFSSVVCALSQNTPAICEWAHPLTVGS